MLSVVDTSMWRLANSILNHVISVVKGLKRKVEVDSLFVFNAISH